MPKHVIDVGQRKRKLIELIDAKQREYWNEKEKNHRKRGRGSDHFGNSKKLSQISNDLHDLKGDLEALLTLYKKL